MNKEFIPYEQALELKELGFDEPCIAGINVNSFELKMVNYDPELYLPTPLYQQAFKFLREKLITKIVMSDRGDYIEGNFTLLPLIFLNKYEIRVIGESVSYYIDETWGRNIPFYNQPLHRFTESAPTYEEAQLACLKKMIQIVRNK